MALISIVSRNRQISINTMLASNWWTELKGEQILDFHSSGQYKRDIKWILMLLYVCSVCKNAIDQLHIHDIGYIRVGCCVCSVLRCPQLSRKRLHVSHSFIFHEKCRTLASKVITPRHWSVIQFWLFFLRWGFGVVACRRPLNAELCLCFSFTGFMTQF